MVKSQGAGREGGIEGRDGVIGGHAAAAAARISASVFPAADAIATQYSLSLCRCSCCLHPALLRSQQHTLSFPLPCPCVYLSCAYLQVSWPPRLHWSRPLRPRPQCSIARWNVECSGWVLWLDAAEGASTASCCESHSVSTSSLDKFP